MADTRKIQKGSVNSWQTGGFDFNLDNVTGNAFTDLVENFKVDPLTPGVFTIPICAPGVRFSMVNSVFFYKSQLSEFSSSVECFRLKPPVHMCALLLIIIYTNVV